MRKLVLNARENEDKRLMLMRAFEPLIKKCIRIYVKKPQYFEDGMQEGYTAVLHCINNYDVDSKYPFPAYVKRAVIYSIRDFSKKIRENISLDEKRGEEEISLYDVLEDDSRVEDECILKDEIKRLMDAMKTLTPKQQEIIYDFYFKNKSMREIAKNRRCHYMAIVGLKERALNQLKKQMQKQGPVLNKMDSSR